MTESVKDRQRMRVEVCFDVCDISRAAVGVGGCGEG